MTCRTSSASAEVTKAIESGLLVDGFAAVTGLVAAVEIEAALESLEPLIASGSAGTRRGVGSMPFVQRWLAERPLAGLLPDGADWFPVRAILFDKSSSANWGVPWHQDLAIAVQERIEAPGFGPWSVKQGIVHVHPPVAILENMVTVRLSLDDCGTENGALRVLPGSHRSGRLNVEDIEQWKRCSSAVECIARRGDAVLMKPLVLHSSLPAAIPARRRVLHVEFAREPLPHALKWESPAQ